MTGPADTEREDERLPEDAFDPSEEFDPPLGQNDTRGE